jgi:Zn-dependent protease
MRCFKNPGSSETGCLSRQIEDFGTGRVARVAQAPRYLLARGGQRGKLRSMIADILVWYLVFVFSTTCHEFAHAFVALRGGDTTAYEGGQVSLDPTPHIKRSPFGMVVVPMVSMFLSNMTSMIGWGAAPYNPFWASRHPKRYAVMSLAGPSANILLATIAFTMLVVMTKSGVLELSQMPSFDTLVVPIEAEVSSPTGALAKVLSVMFSLNVLLAIFNLLPVPPLDGAAVLEGFWPEQVGSIMAKVRETPMFGLLGLLVVWQLVPYVVTPVWVNLVILMHQL